VQFELTPKALANVSPGLERLRQPRDHVNEKITNAESVRPVRKELLQSSKEDAIPFIPVLKQPWAEISQRLRRIYFTTFNSRNWLPQGNTPKVS
jgi:hypothetical protein